MVDALDNPEEEARRGLSQEVTALRKQSVFALILAVLFILITVYLYFQLQESKENLEKSNDSLLASKKLLEAQNDSIMNLKNLLSDFREQYLKETAPAVASQPRKYNSLRKYDGSLATKADAWETCFGYLVYIQDRRGSRVSGDIRKVLKGKGAIVPAIEHINERVKFSSSVRYFHKEDKGMAEFMQGLILKTLETKKIRYTARQLPVSYIASSKVPLGQLEVWIDQ